MFTETFTNKSMFACSLTILGTLIFAVCNAFVKKVGGNIPISTIVLVQSAVCIIYCLPWLYQEGVGTLKTQRPYLHIVRGIAELVAIYPLYWSFQYIPMIDGLLLNNAAPLWVPFFLLILQRIRMKRSLWWGLILGFIGVLLVLRPDRGIINWASILAMFSGIATAYIMVVLAQLGKTEPSKRIIFYCFATCFIVLLPIVIMQWKTPDFSDWIFMLLSGICLVIAMTLFNHAFRIGKTAVLSPLFYLTVVFGGLIDWVVWQQVPTLLTVLGCLLVMIGGIVTIILEQRGKE